MKIIIIDNSSIKLVKLIEYQFIYKLKLGFIFKSVIKKCINFKKYKNNLIINTCIIQLKKNILINKQYNIKLKHNFNTGVVLDKKMNPVGNKINSIVSTDFNSNLKLLFMNNENV